MRNRLLPPAVLFVLALPVFSRIVLSGDHLDHVSFALKMLHGSFLPPHPLFHTVLIALAGGDNGPVCPGMAVFLLAAAVAARAWLTTGMLTEDRDPSALSPAALTFFCLVLAVAMPLPAWWHGDVVTGQVSPNVWHNPTTVFAMPFALGLFIAGNRLLKDLTLANASLVSLLIILSLLAKPNYVLAYAPYFGLALLAELGRATRSEWLTSPRALGLLLIVLVPAAIVLASQYLVLRRDTTILYAPLEVWRSYSRNITGAVLIGIAFPLAVILCYPDEAKTSQPLAVAWATLGTAVVTFACFAEWGKRIVDGNFGWGIVMADHVLFVVSLDFLLRQPGGLRRAYCLAVFCLYALSGISFLAHYS